MEEILVETLESVLWMLFQLPEAPWVVIRGYLLIGFCVLLPFIIAWILYPVGVLWERTKEEEKEMWERYRKDRRRKKREND